METARVLVERLPHGADLPLPTAATALSSGVDLMAAVSADVTLAAGDRALVPTGLRLALPAGFEAQVRSRSGLALKHGLMVLNSPGTIDADYRGEVGVILANLGREPFVVQRGMKIAQLVVAPVAGIRWEEARELPPSGRGAGGFGSTGMGGA
ncbi:MAG: dUTP diphosphatase [Planctomycetes bacterium]|nr:dUTP diphosphatase [Planctomycetota bacterium]